MINKLVIFAGGLGTRLTEETIVRPKPMVEIGEKPILWHIMKIYSYYGINEFIICLGYKGYQIKEYFKNYGLHNADVTYDYTHPGGKEIIHSDKTEPWKVTLVETGLTSTTSQRLKRIEKYMTDDIFYLTYGDGVSDIDINLLTQLHFERDKIATMTAVKPEGRWGALDIGKEDDVLSFIEKPRGDNAWINGGFFVLSKCIFKYLKEEDISFEEGPLKRLVLIHELNAYKHTGFWHAMDTLRDKRHLEDLWVSGNAPWKLWKE
jgi:glucose-1-phosphate cytidylyltransferase